MRIGQSMQPFAEPCDEILLRAGAFGGLAQDRLDDAEQVLRAMRQFAQKDRGLLVLSLVFRDVMPDRDGAGDFAGDDEREFGRVEIVPKPCSAK